MKNSIIDNLPEIKKLMNKENHYLDFLRASAFRGKEIDYRELSFRFKHGTNVKLEIIATGCSKIVRTLLED